MAYRQISNGSVSFMARIGWIMDQKRKEAAVPENTAASLSFGISK